MRSTQPTHGARVALDMTPKIRTHHAVRLLPRSLQSLQHLTTKPVMMMAVVVVVVVVVMMVIIISMPRPPGASVITAPPHPIPPHA
eukprot:COSAG01_NODE_5114_length_4474_cov_12.268114_6_plen_86_part_00